MSGTHGEEGEGAVQARIRAARAGDALAMERLLDHLRPRLAPFVEQALAGTTGRVAQADDVLQHTLLGLSERLPRMPFTPSEAQLLSFARRAARYRIADLQRELARWQGESAMADWDAAVSSAATGTVTRADAAEHLRQLVARLPARTAEVVQLCALDGLSFVEAAERLGEQADAVRKRYAKALELLRGMLSQDGGG